MKFIKVLLVAETKGVDSCPADRQCDISQVQSLLVESSYNVTVAKSFQEAYVKIRDEQFELFLIDHEPARGFSACPLLEIISKDERLCRVPAVVMSYVDEQETVAKCLHLGAADYLVKPLRKNELKNLWTHTWRRSKPAMEPVRLQSNTNLSTGAQKSHLSAVKVHTSANFYKSAASYSSPNSSSEDEDSAGSNCDQRDGDYTHATAMHSIVRGSSTSIPMRLMQYGSTPSSPCHTVPPVQERHETTEERKLHAPTASRMPPAAVTSAFKTYNRGLNPEVGSKGSGGPALPDLLMLSQEAALAAAELHGHHAHYSPKPSAQHPSAQETLMLMLSQQRAAAEAHKKQQDVAAGALAAAHPPINLAINLANQRPAYTPSILPQTNPGAASSAAAFHTQMMASSQFGHPHPPAPPGPHSPRGSSTHGRGPPPPGTSLAGSTSHPPHPILRSGGTPAYPRSASPSAAAFSNVPQLGRLPGPYATHPPNISNPYLPATNPQQAPYSPLKYAYLNMTPQPQQPSEGNSINVLGSIPCRPYPGLPPSYLQDQNQMRTALNKPLGATPPAPPHSPPAPYPPYSQPAPAQAPTPPTPWGGTATGDKRMQAMALDHLRMLNRPSGGLSTTGVAQGSHHPTPDGAQSTSAGQHGGSLFGKVVEVRTNSSDASRRSNSGVSAVVHGEDPGAQEATKALSSEQTQKQLRQEALRKFQVKKQFRSFEKKILYSSRKQLAEKRPRHQGKFMRVEKVLPPKGPESDDTHSIPGKEGEIINVQSQIGS